MKEVKRRRKHCIICKRELPKIAKKGKKRNRILTCSPNCSKTFIRIRIHALGFYIREIKELKEELKRK